MLARGPIRGGSQAHLAVARVPEQPPASTATSLPKWDDTQESRELQGRLPNARDDAEAAPRGTYLPGDANRDLEFLTIEELEAVIRAIPDEVVTRRPAPPPPDVLGHVLRVLVLAAANTGLRQSELLGLRWRDVDWTAQRIRVRNAYVRGEHSGEGKSGLSTRRSVPMADRLAGGLDRWRAGRCTGPTTTSLFAHPQSGRPLDRSKVSKRFKEACRAAGVRPVRFHDVRHRFGTRLAATGQPIRAIQEFLGHADVKTTQIYMHDAPSERELAMVNEAFPTRATGTKRGTN